MINPDFNRFLFKMNEIKIDLEGVNVCYSLHVESIFPGCSPVPQSPILRDSSSLPSVGIFCTSFHLVKTVASISMPKLQTPLSRSPQPSTVWIIIVF